MTLLAFGQPDNAIIQMAYTVPDLNTSMLAFTANMRVGPWFVFRRLAGHDPQYRGEKSWASNDIALGFAGHMQIELIQPLDDHPSVYRERIAIHGYGFHHFGVAARAFDQECEVQQAKGYDLAFTDAVEGVGRVAYFDTKGALPGMLELIEVSPELDALFGMMHAASVDWDGSQMVREMTSGDGK
ncbi:VOC family protein [Sphingomonas sp. HH69]